ncbi:MULTISPECIES: hypothetical protein [Flavobacterium]|uniref:Acyl carrier protein n=1 Tax=Flavobacterium hankyongi TaxID=1176532 RepID=A0ABP8ZRX3_9FLAO|nr:hypothetical protein [Flavobacterium sp. N1846]
MKTNSKIKVNTYGLYKILNQLSNAENFKSDLDAKTLRSQLLSVTDIGDFYDDIGIEIEVKRIIILVTGMNKTPEELKNSTKVSFSDMDLIALQEEFEIIIKKHKEESEITIDEIVECKTVKDCVDLVISKV